MTPKETALEARQFSPSTARNRDPIREVFLQHMPSKGVILEIGSGTGEHAIHLSRALPKARWLPGDPDAGARASIAAWIRHEQAANVAAPHALDVTAVGWDKAVGEAVAGVVSINMVHIAPFTAAQGLFAGAGRLLGAGGKLFLYGPFSRDGVHTAPSNAEFDASLKSRDPLWGVRDLERDILPLAARAALNMRAVVAMPANNFSVIFERR